MRQGCNHYNTAATVLPVSVFSLKKASRELHNICRKPSVLFMRFNPFYEMAGGSPRFEDIPDLPANPHQPPFRSDRLAKLN